MGVLLDEGESTSDSLARTVAVNAIAIGQCFYVLNSRYLLDRSVSIKAHLENKYLPMGIGAVVVLQLMFTQLPPLQRIFDTESVALYVWPWLLGGRLLFFFFIEVLRLTRGAPASTSATKRCVAGLRPPVSSCHLAPLLGEWHNRTAETIY